MEFRILGPLEAHENGRSIPLGGAKQRALLALLILHAGEVVSSDRLIDALWGESPPPSAPNSVHIYVSRLRKALGNGRVATRSGGYALDIEQDELDLREFEGLVAAGKKLLAQGESEAARGRLSAAIGLWRGRPLSELAGTVEGQIESERLEELRRGALEEYIEAELACGRAAEIVPQLEAFVRQHPFRERPRGQLMLALYRSGRQAEALEVYRDGRRTLIEELGLEPGREIQELQQAILRQDLALDGPTPVRLPRDALVRRTPLVVAAAAAALLLAVGAVVIEEMRSEGVAGLASVTPNAVGVIDPKTNRTVAQIPVGGRPVALVTGLGAVWVANSDDATVLRIDPKTRRVTRTIGLGVEVADLAVGAGAVWVAGGNDSAVVRIGPEGQIQATIRLPTLAEFGANPIFAVATSGGSVWAAASGGLYRIYPHTNQLGKPIPIDPGNTPLSAAATSDTIWAVLKPTTVVGVSPALRSVIANLELGEFLNAITAGEGAVWVADDSPGTVWRISPATNRVAGSTSVGGGSWDLAVGEGAVWSANTNDGTASRIDPDNESVVARVRLGHYPVSIALGYGAVWVGVAATPNFP